MRHEYTHDYNISGADEARSLYIHVPFCEAKCPYCAFASAPVKYSGANSGDTERYIDAIKRELAARTRGVHTLDTLYVGGGTPSVLPMQAWEKLLDLFGRYFNFVPGAEMTVEANPGSLEKNKAALWKDWGANRISVGVQSLNDDRLNFLGRIHDSRQAIEAIELCLGAGFSVSLDMMFGLPGETLRDWMTDLRAAIKLEPHHISVYQLSIESGTPFAEKNFTMPEGYAQYRYAQWRLARAGYKQYEVASFTRPGYESRHNLNYWAGGDYIGIGPAAWSYVNGARFRNAPLLDEYCRLTESGSPVVFSEEINGEPAAREAAVLALRTTSGIDWARFVIKFGDSITKKLKDELRKFPDDIVQNSEDFTRLTAKGFRVGNAVWREIV